MTTPITQQELSGLYVLTDERLMPDDETLINKVLTAIQGGAKIIQYRDKSGDRVKRLRQSRLLKQLCVDHSCLLIINDDVGLAKESYAHGVHLGQSDGSINQAREELGPTAIIGVTCHDQISLARQAVVEGADYVAFGAFFKSRTKPNATPAPLSLLSQVTEDSKLEGVPVVAIGGITVDNATQVIQAGANMIAVVDAVFAASDIKSQASAFTQLFPSND